MDQRTFQLAREYEKRIGELREDLARVDRCEVIEMRGASDRAVVPEVYRTRKEDPKLFAIIKAHLETELEEYETKFKEL